MAAESINDLKMGYEMASFLAAQLNRPSMFSFTFPPKPRSPWIPGGNLEANKRPRNRRLRSARLRGERADLLIIDEIVHFKMGRELYECPKSNVERNR